MGVYLKSTKSAGKVMMTLAEWGEGEGEEGRGREKEREDGEREETSVIQLC